MNVNIKFSGAVEKILEEAVRQGYASTKTEALRMGVLELNSRYNLLEQMEDREDAARADAIMDRIVAGKEKLYTKDEIMKIIEDKLKKGRK